MRRGLWLWAVIGGALLLHATFLTQRATLERGNDTVELVLEYDEVVLLAESAGLLPGELLTRWHELGVTSAAVGGADAANEAVPPDAAAARDAAAWDAVAARDVGLAIGRVVPRTLAAATAAASQSLSVGPYIPRGTEVEGFPDELAATASTLANLHLSLGLVEFAGAAGRDDVVRLLDNEVVIVHSITNNDLNRLSDGQAVARLRRAALERQARLLYIHLRPEDNGPGVPVSAPAEGERLGVGADPVAHNTDYLTAIVAAVQGVGLRIGPAVAAPRWNTPWWLPVTAALAAAAALLLVVEQVLAGHPGTARVSERALFVARALLLSAPVLVVGLMLLLGWDVLARQVAALAVALAFPVLAIVLVFPEGSERRHCRFAGVARGTLIAAGVGVVGAMFVAGALGESVFLLNLEQFRGVKLAHVVPFVALAGLWLLRGWPNRFASGTGPEDGAPGSRAAGPRGVRLTWQYLLLGVLVLGFGYVLVARTGHDLLPVSDIERALREWLETTLPVRPRTKEFLLGYPALILGLWLVASPAAGRERLLSMLSAPLLITGAVVPVSVINTFAHAHIPLSVSLVRTGLGLLLGSVVGLAGVGVFSLFAVLDHLRARGRSGQVASR